MNNQCGENHELPLSVAIITKNEAHNLPRLLDSLRALAPSEIVVFDAGSQDQTVALAEAHGVQIFETDWPGYGVQKNRALRACTQPWVLSLDADEPISDELAENIRTTLSKDDKELPDGYEISRRTWYLGDWLRYTWYPEWRLRLVRRDRAHWTAEKLHERLCVDGRIDRLSGDILHFSYNGVEDHFQRTIEYARIGAETLNRNEKRFRWYKITLSPLWRFLRLIVLKSAWRDGWRGWIIAWSSMLSGFLKYAFLYELERKQNEKNKKIRK